MSRSKKDTKLSRALHKLLTAEILRKMRDEPKGTSHLPLQLLGPGRPSSLGGKVDSPKDQLAKDAMVKIGARESKAPIDRAWS
jgi:hypothetical protein